MPYLFIGRVLEQAREREPSVKAMALLQAARVLAVMDRKGGERAFAEGIAEAERLDLPVRQMEHVWNDAVKVGAIAAPAAAAALFRQLSATGRITSRHFAGAAMVQTLAQSGEFALALELLEDLNCEVGGAMTVISWSGDPVVKRRAMEAGRERWRAIRNSPEPYPGAHAEHDFFHMFSLYWHELEPLAQQRWLDEILESFRSDPDTPTHSGFGERVVLNSMHNTNLFRILHVVKTLKPVDEVEALLREHPEVAEAAKVYPMGMESLMAEAREARKGAAPGQSFIRVTGGERGDGAAVDILLSEARVRYEEDADPDDPNVAPKVFWPSSHAYQQAMYWAGDRSGLAAEPKLMQIPDADLRLLASIQMAAGTLGLPEHFGVRMEHHPARHRRV